MCHIKLLVEKRKDSKQEKKLLKLLVTLSVAYKVFHLPIFVNNYITFDKVMQFALSLHVCEALSLHCLDCVSVYLSGMAFQNSVANLHG